MSDPNQPANDPYQQQFPSGDPYYGGYPPASLPYNTPTLTPKRPVSPIVLGIIGILYAAQLTFCMGAGLAMQLSGERFIDWLAGFGTFTPEQIEQMRQQAVVSPWMIIQSILWVVLGIVCWVGSIGSFLRKEPARVALLLFSVGFLALGLLSHGIEAARGFPALKAQTEIQSSSGTFTMPLGALIGLTLFCAGVFAIYPICVLWFYTRPKVKAWFRREQATAPAEGLYYPQ